MDYRLIFRNLFRRKTRSLLTLAGISVGIAAIVALGALAEGLQAGYGAMSRGSGADLMILQAESYDITISSVDESLGERLRTMPEVRAIAGMILGNVSTEGGARYFFLYGHDPYGFAIQRFKIIEGEDLLAGKRQRGQPLILGRKAAQALKKNIGDTIRISSSTFRITGIYETGNAMEEGGAVISLADAQMLLKKPRQVSAFLVKLKNTDQTSVDRLRDRLARLFPDVTVTTSTEFATNQDMVKYLRGFAWAIALIAIIIGGVGMMNTVLMSVFERTQEIGVLRALGWRRRQVLELILGESLLLALVGAVIGIALGIGLVFLVAQVPLFGYMGGCFTPSLFAQAFGVAVTLGSLGGFYPAWIASGLTPIEALRQEAAASGPQVSFGSLALRNLFRRRTRTLLTLVGITLAVAAIVALRGLSEGYIVQLNNMASSSGFDLMAEQANASDLGYSAIDEKVGKRLAAHPEVKSVSGILIGVSFVPSEKTAFFLLFGYHPAEPAIRHFRIVEGQPLTANRQIILGRAIAKEMKKGIGDTVRLFDASFQVVGIYETGIAWEDMAGVISLREAQAILGKPRQVSLYGIELKNRLKGKAVRDQLAAEFPEVSLSMSSEFAENLPDMQSMEAMIQGIAFLSVLVGGIAMMNTVLMSVFERTREIGVLRALGWRRRRVLGLILGEALLLSLVSGITGIGLGVGLVYLMNLAPYMRGFVVMSYSPKVFTTALITALTLGMVGGVYPAWRAANLRPIEALRYE